MLGAAGGAREAVPVGDVDWGDLRRLRPISTQFGFDRGIPVDRYYIERFLSANRQAIRGRVLEVGDAGYTRRFGGQGVRESDVLHARPGNPAATIIADLADAPHIASERYDCVILTQTLQLIFDVPASLRTLRRILAPAGTLLATAPGITQLSDAEWRSSWYWSFTDRSLDRLAREQFAGDHVSVELHGNVLAATAFLHGLAAGELTSEELDVVDANYPVTLTLLVRRGDGA